MKTNDFIVSAITQTAKQAIGEYDWNLPIHLSFPKNESREQYQKDCLDWGQQRYDAIVSDVIARLDGEFDIANEDVLSDIGTTVDELIQNEIFNNMTDMFCVEKVTVTKQKCFVVARSPKEAMECFEGCYNNDDDNVKPIFCEEKQELPFMVRSLNEKEIDLSDSVWSVYNQTKENE